MLKTGKLLLRAIEPGDIDLLYQWENNTEIWKVSNTITPFSRHVLEQYINSIQDIYVEKQLRLIIEILLSPGKAGVQRKQIGCVDLFDFDPQHLRAGIGILIAEKKERGKGYASEALGLLVKYAFQTLGLHQLYCNIPVDNKASIKLFRKHKFRVIGKKEDWIKNRSGWTDEYFLQLISK